MPSARINASLASALLVTSILAGCVVIDFGDCIVIGVPGTYNLENDVVAGAGDVACIDIIVSHVILDGHGYTVSAGHADNLYGIRVGADSATLTNVTIKNIYVVGFGEDGIHVTGVSDMDPLTALAQLEGIAGGLDVDGPSPADVQVPVELLSAEFEASSTEDGFTGLTLEHVVSIDNVDDGLDVSNANGVDVSWSLFNNNGDVFTSGNGIELTGVSDVVIGDSVASFNEGRGILINAPENNNDIPLRPVANFVNGPGNENILLRCLELVSNGESGLKATGVTGLTVAMSVINENGDAGIKLLDFYNVSILENVINENGAQGVFLIESVINGDPAPIGVQTVPGNGLAPTVALYGNLLKANGVEDGDAGLQATFVAGLYSNGNIYLENYGQGALLNFVFGASFTGDIFARNADDGLTLVEVQDVYITGSRIIDNGADPLTPTGDGVQVTNLNGAIGVEALDSGDGVNAAILQPVPNGASVEIHGNVIAGNADFGVNNDAIEHTPPAPAFIIADDYVNATGNYWGAANGPGSPADPDAPFEDPMTGTEAEGDGDNVSESSSPGISNVLFDPFLTEEPDVPDLPEIQFYQADLAVGIPLCKVGPGEHGGFYSDDGRLIRFMHGNTEDGEIRQGTTPLLSEYADCLSDVSIVTDEANSTATATFTVAEDCELIITFASYEKPDNVFSRADTQVRYDSQTMVFGPGTHTLTVDLPDETA